MKPSPRTCRRVSSCLVLGSVLGIGAVGPTGASAAAAGSPTGTVTGTVIGTVFYDIDLDGMRGPGEPGVEEASVRAVDAAEALVAAAPTAADGSYVLQVAAARSSALRIQIIPPEGYAAGPHHGGAGTTVEFVTLGAPGPQVALTRPTDPRLAEAPVEVGNRVWRDLDRDGRQDPQEPAIGGVGVSLWGPGGRIASAVTDAQGRFFFSSREPDQSHRSTPSAVYGVRGLRPQQPYSLRLDNAVDYASGPLRKLTVTATAAGPDRAVDSDGAVVNMFARATFTAPPAGGSDHTIDFGFIPVRNRAARG